MVDSHAAGDAFSKFLEAARTPAFQREAEVWAEMRAREYRNLTDFRVPRSDSHGEDLLEEAIERMNTYWSSSPDLMLDQRITPGQRAAYALYWTRADVGNGGLYQYFESQTGDLLPEAVEGADLVGATALAEALRRAASHLGQPYPRDPQVRGKALARLPEQFWVALDDTVYPLLEGLGDEELGRYIESHPDEFFLPAK
jgi:hypothetical protein